MIRSGGVCPRPSSSPAAMEVAAAPKTDRVVELERRLEETIAELKALRAEFDAFKAQLGA